jgi:hypothetical protein
VDSQGLVGRAGIPCEVFLVRRVESHWCTVQFYTNLAAHPNLVVPGTANLGLQADISVTFPV